MERKTVKIRKKGKKQKLAIKMTSLMPAFNSGSSSVIPATINIANPGLRSRNNPGIIQE